MGLFLGIDTSNYTTSVAVYDNEKRIIIHKRKLLPVKNGQLGLRQSDAVFHHTNQFFEVYSQLAGEVNLKNISAIGVSSRPRPVENSYMPCFSVGLNIAKVLADTLDIPLFEFSHQEGHIAAAIYSCNMTDLLYRSFIAFHLSGGTTEALLVKCGKRSIDDISIIAQTLDLNAGQVIDRAGVKIGLDFPCGKELEALACDFYENIESFIDKDKYLKSLNNSGNLSKKKLFGIKTSLKDGCCCLSGVENKCAEMVQKGEPKEKTAAYCLAYIEETLYDMTVWLINKYGYLPLVYAGGVMSDSIIRSRMENEFDCSFASPEFSSDNAGGIAFLAGIEFEKAGECCDKHIFQ